MEIKTSWDIAYEFQQKETDNVRWVRVDDIIYRLDNVRRSEKNLIFIIELINELSGVK